MTNYRASYRKSIKKNRKKILTLVLPVIAVPLFFLSTVLARNYNDVRITQVKDLAEVSIPEINRQPLEKIIKTEVDYSLKGAVHPTLYTDPQSTAAMALQSATDPEIKRKLGVLASTPTGIWQVYNSNAATFKAKMDDAKSQSKTPIVVLYAIPNIGCGTSGAPSLAAYQIWIQQRAEALNGTKSIVIVEPDAVAMFDCLSVSQLALRKQSLNMAIDELSKTDANVYVDAGHPVWVGAAEMGSRLQTIDMAKTRGISVNVSNFQTNEKSATYATNVLKAANLEKLRAIIDTSRNGNGSPADNQWCNALERKVGTTSIVKSVGMIDAYLWIKVPGESDGTGAHCSNGISEGQFWLEYALGLVD